MNTAVTRAVRLVPEPRLADRAVRRDEPRHDVARAERGRDGDLRVDGRRGAARRRLGVTAEAAVEVEAGTEPFADAVDLLEVLEAGGEESLLLGGQALDGSAGAGGTAADPWVARPELRLNGLGYPEQRQGDHGDQQLDVRPTHL